MGASIPYVSYFSDSLILARLSELYLLLFLCDHNGIDKHREFATIGQCQFCTSLTDTISLLSHSLPHRQPYIRSINLV